VIAGRCRPCPSPLAPLLRAGAAGQPARSPGLTIPWCCSPTPTPLLNWAWKASVTRAPPPVAPALWCPISAGGGRSGFSHRSPPPRRARSGAAGGPQTPSCPQCQDRRRQPRQHLSGRVNRGLRACASNSKSRGRVGEPTQGPWGPHRWPVGFRHPPAPIKRPRQGCANGVADGRIVGEVPCQTNGTAQPLLAIDPSRPAAAGSAPSSALPWTLKPTSTSP